MSDEPPQSDWDRAAVGWGRRRAEFEQFAAPVAHWLVDAIEPQPGDRLLELAAGVGESGFLALEIAAPGGGGLICSDSSEQMLEQARVRAEQLGLVDTVEFKEMHGEWIDAELASLDGVLCRFGLMLMDDPAACLREARRVLKPGGRIAVAVWDERSRNPQLGTVTEVLAHQGHDVAASPGAAPGPFALSAPGVLSGLLADAGFADVELQPIELIQRAASFDAWWEAHLDLSLSTRTTLAALAADQVQAVREAVRERFRVFAAEDGSLSIPAQAIGATAEA